MNSPSSRRRHSREYSESCMTVLHGVAVLSARALSRTEDKAPIMRLQRRIYDKNQQRPHPAPVRFKSPRSKKSSAESKISILKPAKRTSRSLDRSDNSAPPTIATNGSAVGAIRATIALVDACVYQTLGLDGI